MIPHCTTFLWCSDCKIFANRESAKIAEEQACLKLEELKCENKILEVEHDIFNMHLDEINEEQDRMKNKLEELVAEKQKVFKTNFKENKQGADSEGS